MIKNYQTFINEGAMNDHIFIVVKVFPFNFHKTDIFKDLRKQLSYTNVLFKSVSGSRDINEIIIGPLESEEQVQPIAKLISDFISISDFKAIPLGDAETLVKYIANRSKDLNF